MPKITNTRLDRAQALLQRMAIGPYIVTDHGQPKSDPNFQKNYRIWFDSWVLPDITTLIPEFRQMTITEIYNLVNESRTKYGN